MLRTCLWFCFFLALLMLKMNVRIEYKKLSGLASELACEQIITACFSYRINMSIYTTLRWTNNAFPYIEDSYRDWSYRVLGDFRCGFRASLRTHFNCSARTSYSLHKAEWVVVCEYAKKYSQRRHIYIYKPRLQSKELRNATFESRIKRTSYCLFIRLESSYTNQYDALNSFVGLDNNNAGHNENANI
jgi:hypothetical protein